MRFSLSLLAALLTACPEPTDKPEDSGDDSAEDTDTGTDTGFDTSTEVDADGDGVASVASGGTDCDDGNSAVFPGATEACNGADDDCDGSPGVDEVDGDGDGARICDGDCADADAAILPGALEACDSVDNDCDSLVDAADPDVDPAAAVWYRDRDGDGQGVESVSITTCDASEGYVHAYGDCDDTLASIYLGAPELCDDEDNDCDGSIDDDDADVVGQPTWYADADADAWGDPATSTVVCFAPDGFVASDLDCDDTTADVNPDAAESCNGVDDDCDGALDDADTDVVDLSAWYADADGDGWGVLPAMTSCDPGAGWSAAEGDCDDASGSTYPGAADAWYDGVDADCVGDSDYDQDGDGALSDDYAGTDCDDTVATTYPGAAEAWYDGVDADCAGDSDYDQDGDSYLSDAWGGDDCDDTTAATYPGAAEVWYDGLDGDCAGGSDYDQDGDGADADAWGGADCADTLAAVYPGAAETWYDGVDSDCAGDSDYDQDGDGYVSDDYAGDDCDDLVATAHPGGFELFGDAADNDCDGTADSLDLSDYDGKLVGETAGDGAGRTVTSAGDMDNDGVDDLVVSSWTSSRAGSYRGLTYVVSGPVSGSVDLSTAAAFVHGVGSYQYWGQCLGGPGDVDGDGYNDLLIGSEGAISYSIGSQAGVVVLMHGPFAGTTDIDAGFRMEGAANGDRLCQTSAAGDVDGDGNGDILVASDSNGSGGAYAGAVWLFGDVTADQNVSAARGKYIGEEVSDMAGRHVATAGDLDGDGYSEFLIAAPGNDSGGTSAGAVYILYGPTSGTTDLSLAEVKLTGTAGGTLGYGITAAGDVDDDGTPDILLSAPNETTTPTKAGRSYLVSGSVSSGSAPALATATITGSTASEYAGSQSVAAGDVNADGFSDLLLGAYNNSAGGTYAGAAYLLLGPVSGSVSLGSADATFVGEDPGDYAAYSIAAPGDTDGDGFEDLLIGAMGDGDGGSGAGAAYVISGGNHF